MRAKIAHSIDVPFPRRVERLIHLELSRTRYQIVLCRACGRTHLEWFKKEIPEMKSVMDTWRQLLDTNIGLYEKRGNLSSEWELSIRKTTRDLTAKCLMGILRSMRAKTQEHVLSKRAESHIGLTKTSSALQVSDGSEAFKDKSQGQKNTRDWDVVAEYFDDFRQSNSKTEEW
jgi:hypothetical protein